MGRRNRRRGQPSAPRPIVNGRKLSTDQAARLTEAEGLAGGSWRDRQQAAAMVRAVERELGEAAEGDAVQRGVAEAVALLRARGVEVEVADTVQGGFVRDGLGRLKRHQGQLVYAAETVRVARRVDGLVSAWKAGVISDGEKLTADAVRVLWGMAQPAMGSSLNVGTGGGGPDSNQLNLMALKRAYAGARLRAVRVRLGDDKAADVLEAVAGRGETLRSLGTGDQHEANKVRLRRGLAVAREVLCLDDREVLRIRNA